MIRFRTPVKEPEIWLFIFAIAIGIGYGALQIYSTSIIFLILILIIWFFLSNRKNVITNEFNLIIECDLGKNQDYFDKILKHLKKNCLEANLAKIEKEKTISHFIIKFHSKRKKY